MEFDYTFYQEQTPAARYMDVKEALAHYVNLGKKRGAAGSPLADMNFFVAYLNAQHFPRILEIGPGVSPRMIGENVSYYDVRSGENFLEYARSKGVTNTDALPTIHFSSEDGRLKDIPLKFDLIFSSHCIEHTYDFITHVNDVEALLNKNGIFAMVVPDKRYTFDYFRRLTSLGEIIARHYDVTPGHPLRDFIDSLVMAHNDPVRHWQNDHGRITKLDHEMITNALDKYRSTQAMDPSLHSWVFTSDSFREVVSQLADTEMIRLAPLRVYNTVKNSNSFCTLLMRKEDIDERRKCLSNEGIA